jgi:hypothetical protein
MHPKNHIRPIWHNEIMENTCLDIDLIIRRKMFKATKKISRIIYNLNW